MAGGGLQLESLHADLNREAHFPHFLEVGRSIAGSFFGLAVVVVNCFPNPILDTSSSLQKKYADEKIESSRAQKAIINFTLAKSEYQIIEYFILRIKTTGKEN